MAGKPRGPHQALKSCPCTPSSGVTLGRRAGSLKGRTMRAARRAKPHKYASPRGLIGSRVYGMSTAQGLAQLCMTAPAAGPQSFAKRFITPGTAWAISAEGPAALDLAPSPNRLSPVVTLPVKLATLASAQVAAIGGLLRSPVSYSVALMSLGRSVVEGCSTVAWLLDDRVPSTTRRGRTWLLWAISEGDAACTAAEDGGRTGAMSGSPERLASIEAAIARELGVSLDRSLKSKPKDWRLDGIALPGRRALVASAVSRWFPGANGGILYSQVSRQAHSDVLVALALVDEALAVAADDDAAIGFAATVAAFWGLTWSHILAYLGIECAEFQEWRREMMIVIGRPDVVGS